MSQKIYIFSEHLHIFRKFTYFLGHKNVLAPLLDFHHLHNFEIEALLSEL